MDRNSENPMISVNEIPSLSARRAWIEMHAPPHEHKANAVALRKESVDRNIDAQNLSVSIIRRSPQGERG